MAQSTSNSSQRSAVERIVREVLAELRAAKASQGRSTSPASPAASEATLTLTAKVVTGAALEGRLSGVRQLIVPRGAVLTPAARDEIKKHNVTVASAVGGAGAASRPRVHLAVVAQYNVDPLLADLAAEHVDVQQIEAAEVPSAVAQLVAAIATSGRAVLITDAAALAVCLANRSSGVRAALACRLSEIESAVASLSPNLLVLDPTGRSVFELRQLVRYWLRQPEPKCPTALMPYLNERNGA